MTPIEQCTAQHNPEGDDMSGKSQEKPSGAGPDKTPENLQVLSLGQLLGRLAGSLGAKERQAHLLLRRLDRIEAALGLDPMV